jgi:hypothetical protein
MTTTFVLITGAWHGGWAWRPVAEELRAAGCRVLVFWSAFAPAEGRSLYDEVPPAYQELFTQLPFQYFTHAVTPLDSQALGVPVAYLLGSEDISLPPGEYGWHRFAERLGVSPVMTQGSHEACFTQPVSLAKAFLSA